MSSRWIATLLLLLISAPATADGGSFRELSPGVHFLAGAFVPGRQPDGNSVVFTAPRGLVVVDTGRHEAHTAAILDFAARSEKPVVAVINSHWHLDHVGGNPRIRQRYPTVRVHASTAIHGALEAFLADYRAQLVAMLASAEGDESASAPLRAELAILDAGAELGPDEPVTETTVRTLGGLPLELHLAPHAATAGDVWIFEPRQRVLVAGDLVTLPAPFLDTACPSGWAKALDRLSAVDFVTLVPGHGPPMDRATFSRYHAAFDGLLACGSSDAGKEICIDDWLEGVGDLLPTADHALARTMVDYYLDHHLRGDPARTTELCGG